MSATLPRPAGRKRSLSKAKPFYWSTGPAPRTERGKRRHAARDEQRAAHAKSVWR